MPTTADPNDYEAVANPNDFDVVAQPPSLTQAIFGGRAPSGYVGRGEFAPEAGTVSAPIGPEAQDPLAQVAKGVFGAIGSMVPKSFEEAKQMVTLPMPSADVEKNQQESEQLGAAWRGEYGLEQQAKAITGTALQALPLVGVPFAEAPHLPTLTETIFGKGRVFPAEEPHIAPATEPTTPAISEQAAAEVQPKVGELPNAVQEPSTGAILQREPQETGAPGGQRVGVEQGVQGQETTQAGVQEPQVAPVLPEQPTTTEVADHPTVEVPLSQITLSKDVPQFKAGANEKGVVEPIAGKYERVGTAPVQLWQRNDGSMELISGRHRLDLAQRTGEETIPSQIHKESEGFDATAAARLDAELNIRDNQGSTVDYANYFKNSEVNQGDAEARGLLARAKGKAGFAIARDGSEDLFALHQSGRITDAQAENIARAAPRNAGAQQVGIRAALEGKSADFAGNLIKAATARTEGAAQQTGDLFSFDDTAMREMESQAKVASQEQRGIREQITAVQGAAKKPEVAAKLGVDVRDPAGVQQRVSELKAQLARWDNWPTQPDLVARTRGESLPTAREPVREELQPKLQPGEEQGTLPTGEVKTPEQIASEKAAADAAALKLQQGQDVRVGATKPLVAGQDIRPEKDMFAPETQPEMFGGPGAAGPADFADMGRKPIRIANADIDAERVARGAEPLMSEARKANPVLWDETMSQLDRTPQAAKILVDNINSGEVKTTNNIQQTMLLHEEISLRNEKAMEAERAVDPRATEEQRTEARATFNALEARIDATERAARKAGSIAGSALQARQIAAYDDFTHAALETKFRNAKGSPLTEAESAKIKSQADEIAKLRADLAKAQDQGMRDRAHEALANLIKENLKTAKTEARSGRTIIDILHDQRDAAKARIIERRGRLNAGIDPTSLLDEAIIGASHIADGFVKFAEWSQAMVKDFGERIRPYLADLFQRSQEYHDAHAKLAESTRPKLTPIEKVAAAAKEPTEGGGLTNRMVFDLAREHVRSGVTGLDEVMSAVHKDLESHFPGLTERQVRDMFSDYGKVRFPSKAEDLAALRDYRRQGQLVSALEDAQEKLSPKRTGLQRDQPSARVLELQKQVQDAMRENGITTATDPTRLKTNLDRYKSLLDTRMADAERRLKEGDYAKPTRQATVLDTEAINKRAALDSKIQQINREIEKQRLANRTGFEKFQDASVKWARIAKLASPRVFPKLIEAGLIRVVTNPISRVLSQPLRLIPGLARKAPAQLNIGMRAEAARVASILSSGPEALRKLVGKSKLDALGKKRLLDNEMFNFVGNAHGALKEPVRQGEYAAATKYYTEQALADGLDIREPAVQSTIVSSAVADANWQIFMGDNPFSKYFVSLVVNGLKNGKFTGARTLANAVQFVMPIVKVSSNIAIHTSRLGVGIPESMIRIGTALKRGELANGAEKLSHEDAQAISRSFSAGALGLILASYAWKNPQYFGGVYDENAPKNKNLKTNEIQTPFGVLPGWVNHAPEMQWLNTIASARRVYDKYYAKGSGTANALTEATAFSLMSPVKNLPMIDTWLRYFASRQSAGQTFGSTIRDAVIPGGQSTLGLFDQVERRPQNFLQEIEMGIPGLRQTVPVKSAKPTSTRKFVPQSAPVATGTNG